MSFTLFPGTRLALALESLAGLSVGERAMLAELLHKTASCRNAIEAAGQ